MPRQQRQSQEELLAELMEDKQLVFVYGSLRAGLGNHPVLSQGHQHYGANESTCVGGLFKVEGFGMYPIGDLFPDEPTPQDPIIAAQIEAQKNGYPFCVEEAGSVVAECYEVDGVSMILLDKLEGYPDMYSRKQVSGTDENGLTKTAWVYYMAGYRGRNLVPDGDWVKYLEG